MNILYIIYSLIWDVHRGVLRVRVPGQLPICLLDQRCPSE